MPHFRMEKPLPAVTVSRDLVASLHSYLVGKAKSLASSDDDPEEIASAIRVSIEDELGIETFQSLDQYAPSKFPDTTKAIEISLSGPWRTGLDGLSVEVRFHRERSSSRLKISCKNGNARELAHGLAQGVIECLGPHLKSWGWLHPKPFIGGMIWAILWMNFLVLFNTMGKVPFAATVLMTVSLLLLASYTWILPRLRPYTEFDCRLTDNRLKWWDWFMKGLLGFLVFGTLLVSAKDWLLSLSSGG